MAFSIFSGFCAQQWTAVSPIRKWEICAVKPCDCCREHPTIGEFTNAFSVAIWPTAGRRYYGKIEMDSLLSHSRHDCTVNIDLC
ncbi:MAG: hypothetical protein AAGG53_17740 [Cyanobacteria bacterium P01_H01_bin.152]